MGSLDSVRCLDCGTAWERNEGGGFIFHMLHCEVCGKPRSVSFEEMGEANLRWRKGLTGPWSTATSEEDELIKQTFQSEPLSEDEYKRLVEQRRHMRVWRPVHVRRT